MSGCEGPSETDSFETRPPSGLVSPLESDFCAKAAVNGAFVKSDFSFRLPLELLSPSTLLLRPPVSVVRQALGQVQLLELACSRSSRLVMVRPHAILCARSGKI